jgi:hypothetical protein
VSQGRTARPSSRAAPCWVSGGGPRISQCQKGKARVYVCVYVCVCVSVCVSRWGCPFALHEPTLCSSPPFSPMCLAVEQRSERVGRAGVRVAVNSVAVDPMQPHIFAPGGSDPLGE